EVGEGDLDDDGVGEIGVQSEGSADEESTLGAAHDAQAAGGGDLARDEVSRNRREILEVVDVVLAHRGLVPGRAELAATADIGEDVRSSAGEPRGSERRAVRGDLGDFEAAVSVEKRRSGAVRLRALWA